MKEYLGSELESLREFSEDSTSFTQLTRKYNSIYQHIVSPKPPTFEAWAKSTPFGDIDHYFFATYIASFQGANYLPADCENKKCGETFLTDNIDFMDMVKFDSDETKSKFLELYQSEQMMTSRGIYCSEIVALSDNLAVGFKDASIYDLFEMASLDDKFKNNFASILAYIPYIDTIYMIDKTSHSLVPVGYKVYPDNNVKTAKSKIMKFNNVLKTLTVDEFGAIKAFVRDITKNSAGISYVYPSLTCPKCGKEITEKPATAEELVFTRYQLGALVNTSLN